jgi:hypothetical protein
MMCMAKITMLCGVLLLIEGFIFYLGWQQLGAAKQSVTALIPAFVGFPLVFLGAYSQTKPNLRMHLMHAAVTLTLLGFLAAGPRGVMILAKKGVGPAAIAQILMALICLLHVVLSVRSFIAARRLRESAGESSAAQ